MTMQYVYRLIEVEKVTDGDTYWLRLDVGFRQWMLVHCRLLGYDTPEKYRPASDFERRQAEAATQYAANFLEAVRTARPVWVRTEKDPDNFGRWLAEIWVEIPDGVPESLGEALMNEKLASQWPTRWRDQFGGEDAQADSAR